MKVVRLVILFLILFISISVFVFAIYQILIITPSKNKEVLVQLKGSYTPKEEDKPQMLFIPKIKVEAHVVHVGLTKEGNMVSPKGLTNVGWYKYGTLPGYSGSAVIAGHLDNALALSGVFKDLKKLEAGDDIYVEDLSGKRFHYKVKFSEVYPYDRAPIQEIFNKEDVTRLNLITCAGIWDFRLKTYTERLVVFAELSLKEEHQ